MSTEEKKPFNPMDFGNMEYKPDSIKIIPVVNSQTGERWRGTVKPKVERDQSAPLVANNSMINEQLEELKKKYPHRTDEWLKRSLELMSAPDESRDFFNIWTSGHAITGNIHERRQYHSPFPQHEPIEKDD